jgi:N-acetylneuraminic acid mutarotase
MTPATSKRAVASRRRAGLALFALMTISALGSSPAHAHFLWLAAEREKGKPTVRAFLSETPTPDSAELLKHIERAKITMDDKTLSWAKDDDAFKVALPAGEPSIVDGFCDLGVMTRKSETFRLLYTGRAQFRAAATHEPSSTEHLRVRLVEGKNGPPIVEVTYQGRPVASAVVKAYPETGDPIEKKTDDRGRVEFPGVAEGKTGLLAKWIDKKPGEYEGKKYGEVRYYATLTVAPPAIPETKTALATAPFALMPEAVNSLGAAVAGQWLYVYSGHVGETHKYHRDTTTKHFRRLNLKDRTTWEDLPEGPALQGVTLVAHQGKLYRIGGMSAQNGPNEPDDLLSVADFARFDPTTKTWSNLPSLPEPRSTHDAVVVGDKIYVVGGWGMKGGGSSDADFCEDSLVFDLSKPDSKWDRLPETPFRRRALAVAECGGKIYVLGGLTDEGVVTKAVDIYDPADRRWTSGPELPGANVQGFAASAFGVEGRLYVSGHEGVLHRLNAAGSAWENVGKLAVPRLAHRLVPGIAGDLLAVGGTFVNTPVRIIESISLNGSVKGPKVVSWTVDAPGAARQRQSVALVRSKLIVVGGNRTDKPYAFDAANLVRDGASITLGSMRAEAVAPLPEPRQSAALIAAREGRKDALFLVGGFGPHGDVSRTVGDVFTLDPESRTWKKLKAAIPDVRGSFGAAVYKEAIWLFGGTAWDPRAGEVKRTMATDVLRWEFGKESSTFETTGQQIPRARHSFAGAVLGSKYYLVGGLGDDFRTAGQMDVFDFDSGAWSTIPAPRQTRLFATLAALDDKLYLAGGFIKPSDAPVGPADSIEVFDPATQAWSTVLESSPVPANDLHMFPVQGRLLLYSTDPGGSRQARFALVAP